VTQIRRRLTRWRGEEEKEKKEEGEKITIGYQPEAVKSLRVMR